jgi:TolB-like protein
MEKLETIQCDLDTFKITLEFHNSQPPLVVHFDTPSRRFYFSTIALIISEMKKQDRPGFIHIHRLQEILTRLDQALSGKNASKNVEGMWAKINMAWRHRLPDLESAALFKILHRDHIPPYEKGGKYRYECSEAECDAWASLFSHDENNKWRFKFASDIASIGLNDVSLKLGNLKDAEAWENFIDRLDIPPQSEEKTKASKITTTAETPSENRQYKARTRNIIWGGMAIAAAVFITVVVWRFAFYKETESNDIVDRGAAVYPSIGKPSLAVLPFDNLTGDPQQEYFSNGLADQLITSLSQGPYIYVAARTSSFTFRGKQMTAQEIAAKLRVKYLIEGSVQRDRDQLRINVQLIDGQNGHHIWSKSYDRDYAELFALQDEIGMDVMAALNVKITGYEAGALQHSRPNNLKAYEHYLKGLYYHLGRKRDDVIKARQSFEEAIRIDPNYGRAYTWLANTHLDEIELRLTTQRDQAMEKAEEAVRKALAADPDYPPYGTISRINRIKKDFDNAILYARKGVHQGPTDSGQHYMLCMALHMGEEFAEAVDACKDALVLMPFRPVNYVVQLAWSLVGNKQYDESIPLFKEVLDRSPKSFYAYLAYKGLTAAYQLTGRHADARLAAQNVKRMNPKFSLKREAKLSPAKEGAFKRRIINAYRDAGLK